MMGKCLFMRKGETHTTPASLPTGYTKLEYIQSSGTQYIDSGFIPNQDTRVYAECVLPIASSTQALFGCRVSSSSRQFQFVTQGGYYRTDYDTTINNFSSNDYGSKKFYVDKNKNVTDLNGAVTCEHTYGSFTCPANMYIFATNNNGTVYAQASAKLYCMQVYDNGTLVRDFVPCINSYQEVGLYDLVNKKFYGNAGTGAFEHEFTFANQTWEEISKIAATGNASKYFSIGDTKEITIKGTVGTKSIDTTLYAYIIGFNHDGSKNTIDFGLFKNSSDRGIALVDGSYNTSSTNGTKLFNINHSVNNNSGGWKGCDLRHDVLGSTDVDGGDATATCATNPVANTLMAALPAELRTVMKPMTIYTDNVGGTTRNASNVTATVDFLPLLSEFELAGTSGVANQAEKNYQKQYEYFASGNVKIKYRFDDQSKICGWWLRSAGATTSTWANVGTSGGVASGTVHYSSGLAPIFRV